MLRNLHFCGMLSSVKAHRSSEEGQHYLPWSNAHGFRSVADVPESDVNDDRDAFLLRLGLVLQLARKHAGMTQDEAAAGSVD